MLEPLLFIFGPFIAVYLWLSFSGSNKNNKKMNIRINSSKDFFNKKYAKIEVE